MAKNEYKHVRVNTTIGKTEYFFPMEIHYPEVRTWARAKGYNIARTRLGWRTFEAVMVPCKKTEHDEHGNEFFVDTPTEEQRMIYLQCIRDELREQDAKKQDGRCQIPNGRGGLKRCPCRMPNPRYADGNGEPKTLPVKCEGCKYEPFKQAHTIITMSALEWSDEIGERVPYEPAALVSYDQGSRYEEIGQAFVEYVRKECPRLIDLAKQRIAGYDMKELLMDTSLCNCNIGLIKKRSEKSVFLLHPTGTYGIIFLMNLYCAQAR